MANDKEKIEERFENTFAYKLIYIFTIPDEAHKGCLKIGDTTLNTNLQIDRLQANCKELNQAANERIKHYTNTAGIDFKLLHTELAICTKQEKGKFYTESFRDYKVHRVLENSGKKKRKFTESTGSEWFEVDLPTAIKAIEAVKKQMTALDNTKSGKDFIPIVFRPEQEEAIKQTVLRFKKHSRMLWNAKMRFGKTLSALEVVRKCGFKKTILITHRPVVDEGWHEDFRKIFKKEDNYTYGSKKNGDTINSFEASGKNYIYFASIQDLRGSKEAGGKFDKNDDVFGVKWDLVIIDEAHEGTTTKLGDEVKALLFKEKDGTKLLELSGTPFNILNNYDDGNSVYTWDYVQEQKAKQEWEETHFGDSNPYADLPEMRMFTYDLDKLLKTHYNDVSEKCFKFAEFFRTNEAGNFVNEADVKSFLNLLIKEDSFYPFSTEEYRNLFHHTFWVLPGVKEALALQHLLEHHPIFETFKIVNVAGNGDPDDPTGEALQAVKDAIDEAGEDGYTITLSCGKLTTGVSVPEWTAVFMLYGSYTTKASGYLQTIFRVQTPCNRWGKAKTHGYVFDFAPDRALKMVADSVALSTKAGKTKLDNKNRLGDFLNYCPVISIDGSKMKSYEVSGLLQQLKSAYAERAVTKGFDDNSIYNDELLKLQAVDIEQFNNLQKIIGQTKANKAKDTIDVNSQGLTEAEYELLESSSHQQKEKRELSPAEEERQKKIEEAKKMRQTAISILRGISIRMPLLIYGANVEVDEDISLERFIELVDNSSWEEFMPRGVTKEKFKEFVKYYDEDIFIAAGKRIRNLVKNADSLSVTERVRKIAEIFSYFRNPDKETVLTPWRVVNMHMGDCLGGYSFFDSNFEKPLSDEQEPRFIEIDGVTEKTLSNANAKILEINSKTGLYPLYCAYSIFRAKQLNTPDKSDAELWNEAISENIFVICKTPMAKAITKRTLSGYGNVKINAHAFDHLVNDLKNKSDAFVRDVTSQNFWKKGNGIMQFDAVVGNPPYQEMDGGAGASARPVYNLFMENAVKLKPMFISLIMPARWFTGGKGLDSFRDKLLHDTSLRVIHDFQNANDCFENVEIKGGIIYFLWNKNERGDCKVYTHNGPKVISEADRPLLENGCDVFIRQNDAISILQKVQNKNEVSFSTIVSSRKPFGLATNFSNFSATKTDGTVKIYANQKQGYVDKGLISDNYHMLNAYKLFVPKAIGIGDLTRDWIKPILVGKDVCCTETYIAIGGFENEQTAKNVYSYTQTKFFHLLLGLRKVTQDTTKQVYQFVPMQDFSKPWTDAELYAKYGLDEQEIAFIESMIRPME